MKRYLLAATAALLISGIGAKAQDTKPGKPEKPGPEKTTKPLKDKNKLKEYDEIVIKRKEGDKDSKVTVEIKDGEVFVDGKPIDQFENEDISVKKRSHNRFQLHSPASPFRFEGGDWIIENDEGVGEERAFLGVMTEGSSNGARIENVTNNSAAEKAGLKPDDVITKVDDKEIFDQDQLSNAIADHKPGDQVTITYKRDGKENKTTATLGKRVVPDVRTFPRGGEPVIPPMAFNFDRDMNFNHNFEGEFGDGIRMHMRPRLGIKAQDTEDGAGVKVIDVEEGSAAAKAGIKEDDIITSFEGKKVNSASELAQASRDAREKNSLKVELKRNGKPQTIEVKIPKKLKTANL